MMSVELAAALSLAEVDPVGGAVAGGTARLTGGWTEGESPLRKGFIVHLRYSLGSPSVTVRAGSGIRGRGA